MQSQFKQFLKTCSVTLRFGPEEDENGNINYVIDRVPIYNNYKISELVEYECDFSKDQMIDILETIWHLINRRPGDSLATFARINRDLKYWERMRSLVETWDEESKETAEPKETEEPKEAEVLMRASWKLKYDIDCLHSQSISSDGEFYGQLETAVVNFLSTVEPVLEKN